MDILFLILLFHIYCICILCIPLHLPSLALLFHASTAIFFPISPCDQFINTRHDLHPIHPHPKGKILISPSSLVVAFLPQNGHGFNSIFLCSITHPSFPSVQILGLITMFIVPSATVTFFGSMLSREKYM